MIPTRRRKKKLIETAHREGARLGLAVWNQDEAGPYQAIPQPGPSWQAQGQPMRQPHEYLRNGTAKMLTLLHPATGQVRVQGVISSANAVLHPWLQRTLSEILETLPPAPVIRDPVVNRAQWERWQEGLREKFTLLQGLPPLRMLLIWDNLAGHKTPEMVCWLMRQGIMPLYTPLGDTPLGDTPLGDTPLGDTPLGDTPLGDTPLGGSWLNLVEHGGVGATDSGAACSGGTTATPSR